MKMTRTILALGSLFALASQGMAQAWADAYNTGLKAVRDQKWSEARDAFKLAIASRPEDFSDATRLPGPASERRFWRNGAPYSPNFGAAYAGYKAAGSLTDDAAKKALYADVTGELEAIIAKNQASREAYYVLGQLYTIQRNVAKSRELEAKIADLGGKFTWKVDGELVSAEDKSAINTAFTGTTTTTAGGPTTQIGQPARTLETKYALLIGNSESRLPNGKLGFASTDATMLREKLVQFAGYSEANIDLVTNATAAQMRTSAKALADRVTVGSTIFMYFSGNGANLDGKDFLAGIDTQSATDSANMVAKNDVYRMFMAKGCKIFAFYQAPRPIVAGRYFGQEVPTVGAIAQTQATIPGGTVNGIVRNGQEVGLFTDALGGVLGEFKSNQIPITEFGWRVFDWMRGGRNGDSGTGSGQTMTLPQIVNMLSDERF